MRLWIEKSETFDIWVAYTFRGSNSEEEPANEPENKHASASRQQENQEECCLGTREEKTLGESECSSACTKLFTGMYERQWYL